MNLTQLFEEAKPGRKFYSGIGSRETPKDICSVMTDIATILHHRGFILRSGAAKGADTAFEEGTTPKRSQIFLPWNGFDQRDGIVGGKRGNLLVAVESPEYQAALKIAEKIHPAFSSLGRGARALHTRNVFQVLGASLQRPSSFVICWTKGGQLIGGTATALKIAQNNNIPIFNLAIDEDLQAVTTALNIELPYTPTLLGNSINGML